MNCELPCSLEREVNQIITVIERKTLENELSVVIAAQRAACLS